MFSGLSVRRERYAACALIRRTSTACKEAHLKISTCFAAFAALSILISQTSLATAQTIPEDYRTVLDMLGRTGDFKDAVLKVGVPRDDLHVTISGRQLPTAFGFGGWVAFTKGAGGVDVMMGDLVLTEDEVDPRHLLLVLTPVVRSGLS